jgi:hypothetical protein
VAQPAPIPDDDVVEALPANGPDQTLDDAFWPGERGAVRTSSMPVVFAVSVQPVNAGSRSGGDVATPRARDTPRATVARSMPRSYARARPRAGHGGARGR